MKKSFYLAATISLFLIFTTACSSGPKRQMSITTIQDSCKDSIEAANSCILNGNYTQAEDLLNVARTQALSIDNYENYKEIFEEALKLFKGRIVIFHLKDFVIDMG